MDATKIRTTTSILYILKGRGNLVLRLSIPIEILPLPTSRRILKVLRIEWRSVWSNIISRNVYIKKYK